MSRDRNKREPFYATALSRMVAGPRQIVRELDAVFKRSFGDIIWPGSGWRTGSVEHNSGTAIDWMVVFNVGRTPSAEELKAANEAVNWILANRGPLGVEGLLFSRDSKPRTQAIGYSQSFDRGWRNLANRGSVSANHVDHFHIKFRRGASWPTSLNGVTIRGGSTQQPSTPSLPNTGVNNKTVAQMAAEVIAGRHGNGHSNRQRSLGVSNTVYAQVRAEVNRRTGTTANTGSRPAAPAFPTGLRPNSSSPSAVTLQRKLKDGGFMARNVQEHPNYGPQTQQGVARFHNRHPQFKKSRSNMNTIAIGPKGWKYLFESY